MKIAHSTAPVVAEPGSRVSRILAPTDFSPFSLAAVDATVALVMASPGSTVTLLHVVDPKDEPTAEHGTAHRGTNLPSRINHADRMMKQLRTKYGAHDGDTLETRVMTGDAARSICEMARNESFDLIVTSSHGHMGLARTLIGSVAEQVVQHAPCPVLVTKAFANSDGVPTLRTPVFKFKRIVVGYDHRAGARHALNMARALSNQEGSHVTLVHVLEPAPAFVLCPAEKKACSDRLHKALEKLDEVRTTKLPLSHDWDLRVEVGEPWDVIVKLAKEKDSDLVIVGPHEHTRWGHSYVGSTAQWVVRQAWCPVLVVK
ncbi:universal stress protein [Roseimicrobium sp. ORNL1]|uniref:universal stress protein n=1 Tax=Roseimicrobium sp. ORNL1 TaxID=2711231 RepID=UPI0013E13A84|nr:universal stress protein [Roseimicrobium sp. ORNL1]QIF02354.1 universal stress protein [Roseimicrobium sp. ORNL1]